MLSEKLAKGFLGHLRRATSADVQAIQNMVTRECHFLFGKISIEELIQVSYLPICQMDIHSQIIGFVALDIFTHNPAIPKNGWCYWMHNMYKQYELLPGNTLFVHMICWEKKFSRIFLRTIFEAIFMNDMYLLHIVIVMPPGAPFSVHADDKSFDDILIRINQENYCACNHSEFLYIALRSRFCPKLQVRKAVEEDNDDLVFIIEKHSTRIRQMYGDFYISEILAYNQGSDRTILVGQLDGSTVGVMILNTIVDYNTLNDCFELLPFSNLMRNSPDKKEENSNERSHCDFGSVKIYKPTDDSYSPSEQGKEKDYPREESIISTKETKYNRIMNLHKTRALLKERFHSDDDAVSEVSDDYDLVNLDNELFVIVDLFLEDRLYNLVEKVCYSESWYSEDFTSSSSDESDKKTKHDVFKDTPLIESHDLVEGDGKNAFTIEVFAMDEDIDEKYAFDLLEVSFEIFPDYEYCLISVPTDMKYFPLLDHFVFVPQRPTSCFSHSLYVMHRNCIKRYYFMKFNIFDREYLVEFHFNILNKILPLVSDFEVRPASLFDEPQILELIKDVPMSEIVHKLFMNKMNMEPISRHAYVMLSADTVVGLGHFEPLEDVNILTQNYESRANVVPNICLGLGAVGCVQHLILAPQFQPQARFFLREIHRMSSFYELYWIFSINDILFQKPTLFRNLISTIPEFMPLTPIRITEYSPALFQKYKRFECPITVKQPFAACYINPRLCSYPKIYINTNILVVGGSDTCFAFLECLLFGPSSAYLTFTSITLVSHHGIPFIPQLVPAAKEMIPYKGYINERYFETFAFQMYINVMNTSMTSLKRKEKIIIVDHKQRVKYDLLFLFCGKQYQHPEYLKELTVDNFGTLKDFSYSPDDCLYTSSSSEILSAQIPPFNVFLINDIVDANTSLQCVHQFIKNKVEYAIIVYGATIEAYCCLTGLLKSGIPGSNIVFVEPFPIRGMDQENQFQVSFFNNEFVDKIVRNEILSKDITYLPGYYFQSWDLKSKYHTIRAVKFTSKFDVKIIKCLAFFYYGKIGVEPSTFAAISECGLVYNGGLVIDAEFKTNDASIYAAGPLTKYSCRYNTKKYDHKYYSSHEIGTKLGMQILDCLNPYSVYAKEQNFSSLFSIFTVESICTGVESETDLRHHHIPTIKPYKPTEPIIQVCTFPDNLQYVHVRACGPEIPMEMFYTREDCGQIIITNSKKHFGYFRIHINSKGAVQTITCLNEGSVQIHNIIKLWGRHELLLNKLSFRYQLNQITDLFEFFKEPWACAIYHHKFDEFMDLINKIFLPKRSIDKSTLVSFEETMRYPSSKHQLVLDEYHYKMIKVLKDTINGEFLNFVMQNEELLPMYAYPLLVRFMTSIHSKIKP